MKSKKTYGSACPPAAAAGGVTFGEAAAMWMEAKAPLVRRSTLCAYRLALRTHLLPRLGGLRTVTEADIQGLVADMSAAGMARSTVRNNVAVAASVAAFCRKRGLAEWGAWEVRYPTAGRGRRRVLTLADHRKVMEALRGAPSANGMGVMLALCAGLRIGEVCGLRWEDVDFAARTLGVRRTVGRVYDCEGRRASKTEGLPKTPGSERDVPISATLMRALRAWRGRSASPYVAGASPPPADPRSLRSWFARLLRRLGAEAVTFHGLRHTFATRCVEAGCDVKTLSAILGHSNVATTLNLYVHPDEGQKARCVERMSKFVEGM